MAELRGIEEIEMFKNCCICNWNAGVAIDEFLFGPEFRKADLQL